MNFPYKILIIFILHAFVSTICFAQSFPSDTVTFAILSDTHIGKAGNDASLELVIKDINKNPNISFVIHTGDVSDFGTMSQLKEAKSILDKLNKPYMIVPGNHDTYWSDNAGLAFSNLWGDQKFVKDIKGIRFIGLSTGPYARASVKGYVPKGQLYWLDSIAASTHSKQPVVIVAHIPLLDMYVSNFREVLSRLKQMNVIMVLSGHGHSNKIVNEDGFKSLMTTTTQLRNGYTAYNLITLAQDSLVAKAIYPGTERDTVWTTQSLMQKRDIEKELSKIIDLEAETKYSNNAKVIWDYQDKGNIISTPAVSEDNIFFGNMLGEFKSINISNSNINWKFNTGEAIYSSPAISDGKVVFASADSIIYCLDVDSGSQIWKIKTEAPVIASPIIENNVVYIGGSNNKFRAIDLKSGKINWVNEDVDGFVAMKPSIAKGKLVFGTWNKKLYALNIEDGSLTWSWENEERSAYYSPAICTPFIKNEIVYIVSPDEKLRGFDLKDGKEIFKMAEKGVWESLGGDEKNSQLVAKTTDGSIIAWDIKKGIPNEFMRLAGDFGRDLSPSMPIFNNGRAFFGTNSGQVYAVDLSKRKIEWVKAFSNNMVNTLTFFSKNIVLATSIDGRIMLLEDKSSF